MESEWENGWQPRAISRSDGEEPDRERIAEAANLELFQEFREATSALFDPALDLRKHARQREGRQVQTQRFQHAGQDRLPAGAGQRLVGPARLAGCRRATQRAFGFVVRARHRLASRRWAASTGWAVTNVNNCWASISRITSLTSRR